MIERGDRREDHKEPQELYDAGRQDRRRLNGSNEDTRDCADALAELRAAAAPTRTDSRIDAAALRTSVRCVMGCDGASSA